MLIRTITFLGLILSLLFSCDQTPTPKDAPQNPNILFILVDDLGVRDLGFAGSTFYETPQIDSLAGRSLVFTQGYAGSRVCSPSRATIFTGKFTARHGITDWIGARTGPAWREHNRHDKLLPADYQHELPKADTTLAEAMQANGYTTFFAGKWHLGNEGSYPEDHGFDINVGGWEKGSPMGGYFSPFDNPKLPNQEDGQNLSIRLAEETAAFIKRQTAEPFFAVLSFYAVHGPIQTTQEKWKKYQEKAKTMGLPENGYAMERKLPIRQVQDNPIYGGLVETMDEAVGIALQAIRDAGLEEETIVVFTSDNGGVASGDNFSTSNLPFRGGKGYQWEGGIREPYLICIPWLELNARQVDYPVTGADFFPTLLDYAQIEPMPEQHVDGISLRPLIEKKASLPERPLYWHYPHYGNQGGDPSSIIRQGRWKLIYYYEDDSRELYDLESDPGESINVAQEFPDRANQLQTQLMDWLASVQARYPERDEQFDPEKRAAYDQRMANDRKQNLEENRTRMLSDDFVPNPTWWGSQPTKD